jgi:predicted GNAT family acetyltransferase
MKMTLTASQRQQIEQDPLSNIALLALIDDSESLFLTDDTTVMAVGQHYAALWQPQSSPLTPAVISFCNQLVIEELYGPLNLLTAMATKCTNWTVHQVEMCYLPADVVCQIDPTAITANANDATKLMDFLSQVSAFGYTGDLEKYTTQLATDLTQLPAVYVCKNQKIVGVARVVMQTKDYALIGDVAVDPLWQRHGLASLMLKTLASIIRQTNRTPALIYFDPEAGKLYRKLGYTSIGTCGYAEKEV